MLTNLYKKYLIFFLIILILILIIYTYDDLNKYNFNKYLLYKNWVITKFGIYRSAYNIEINKPITKINFIFNGNFHKIFKKYSNLYHSYICFEMKNNNTKEIKYFTTEKTPYIKWHEIKKIDNIYDNENIWFILKKPLYLEKIMNITKKNMGDNFYEYDFNNNCQIYILEICKSIFFLQNIKLPNNIINFINQDLSSYIPKNILIVLNTLTKIIYYFKSIYYFINYNINNILNHHINYI